MTSLNEIYSAFSSFQHKSLHPRQKLISKWLWFYESSKRLTIGWMNSYAKTWQSDRYFKLTKNLWIDRKSCGSRQKIRTEDLWTDGYSPNLIKIHNILTFTKNLWVDRKFCSSRQKKKLKKLSTDEHVHGPLPKIEAICWFWTRIRNEKN